MKIQVLGSGCPTCKKLYELTKLVVAESGLSVAVEYITDVAKMVEMGVMQGPAVVIDGKLAVVGRVPSVGELKEIIAKHKE